MRIFSLNWKSSDTTGHDTGLGTGLSLARGSGYCFDFPAAFLFDGMTDLSKVEEIMILANCRPRGGGGGGGTLIFSYILLGSGYFGGFKILNFNIFWGFQKNEYFWGIRIW